LTEGAQLEGHTSMKESVCRGILHSNSKGKRSRWRQKGTWWEHL